MLTITDALIERFGLLIIIVLGEILTGVVGGLASQPISAMTISVGLVAVVVGFGAWWTYFDSSRRPWRHAEADLSVSGPATAGRFAWKAPLEIDVGAQNGSSYPFRLKCCQAYAFLA